MNRIWLVLIALLLCSCAKETATKQSATALPETKTAELSAEKYHHGHLGRVS